MADIASLVSQLMSDGTVADIASNPAAQFGITPRRYIGVELLPERTVDENAYRETQIRYRTVIANSSTRYSPSQKKGGDLIGSFLVELGNANIAREMTGRDYDALVKVLGTRPSMEAAASLTNWLERTVNQALIELNEKQRWDAIVNASVTLSGDNGYTEAVVYANPSGHRAAAGGTWSSDAYDPFADISAMADLLASKGYTVSRIVTSRPVLAILSNNANVKARVGMTTVSGGSLVALNGRASLDAVNGALERDGLPPIETYDLQYRTQTGTGYFLPRDVFVLLATTDRDELIDLGDNQTLPMMNTLGYTAIGRATGQPNPGRVIRMEAKADLPPRIEAEGWMTSLPVVTEPEGICVINTIS